jgi:hypothetical protein
VGDGVGGGVVVAGVVAVAAAGVGAGSGTAAEAGVAGVDDWGVGATVFTVLVDTPRTIAGRAGGVPGRMLASWDDEPMMRSGLRDGRNERVDQPDGAGGPWLERERRQHFHFEFDTERHTCVSGGRVAALRVGRRAGRGLLDSPGTGTAGGPEETVLCACMVGSAVA